METFPESKFVMQNTGKFTIYPAIADLPELFVSYFVKVLKVGYEIPRLEYYMSRGLCEVQIYQP